VVLCFSGFGLPKNQKGEKVDMKKILLGVLILFTILTLSSYASAQVYTLQVGDWCLNDVTGSTILLDYDVNLRGNLYCSIVGSGTWDQDAATGQWNGDIWLMVNGVDYYNWTRRSTYSINVSDLGASFHTNLGLYLYRGWNTFQLWAWGSGSPEVCNYSLTIICNNRGEAWVIED
jgi:hypothetical protein